MSRDKLVFGIILFGVFGLSYVTCKRGYILTFPQKLQIGVEENFCLSLFNITTDLTIHLNISCYGKTVAHTPVTFREGHGCFTWKLPSALTAGTCDIHVSGSDSIRDYTISESKEIEVVDTNQITFIQTDRPVYKPGDLVKLRILTVNQDLTPIHANKLQQRLGSNKTVNYQIERITIQDPNDFYMKDWFDVATKTGLASLEYQLYDEPVLGEWKIVAMVNGRKTMQNFTIERYVLPKFQVNMKLPKTLTVETTSLQFEVCARYTFGKPVSGHMNSSVCLINTERSWFCEKSIRPCVHTSAMIDGCHTFSIQTSGLNITDRQLSLLCEPRLVLDVNVTEHSTGVTVQEQQEGTRVWEHRVKMRFLSNKYFKPFFPYTGQLFAHKPDGSPAAGEKVVFTIGKLGIKQTLVTDESGHINFTVKGLTHNTDFFILNAKTLDEEIIDRKQYTIYPATTKKHVKQWYSPTSSYLKLFSRHDDGALNCGNNVTLNAVYSVLPVTYIDKIFLQVISKGNIITSKDVTDNLEHSQHYVPKMYGAVFTPKLVPNQSPSADDDETPESINRPHGPAGSGPIGPPGSGSHAAGPPSGKAEKSSKKVPGVAPVETLELSENHEGTELNFEEVSKSVAPELWQLTLNLHVTQEMAPQVRVLVYMITDTGEMVADTLDFPVNQCHKNKVNMSFKEKSARPGDTVTMTVSAQPDSLCSTSMVDKSVYLYGGNNLLQNKDVSRKLEEFDLTSDFISDWQYCSDMSDLPPVLSAGGVPHFAGAPGSFNDGVDIVPSPFRKKRSIQQFYSNMYDSLLAFKVAGMMALTDLDLQTRPCLHDGESLGPTYNPGDPRGPIPGVGGHIDGLEPAQEPEDNRAPVSKVRRKFPETWLWDLHEIPSTGTVKVIEKLPDTITEWIGNSFCISVDSGLGVSDISRITAFQPFFLSVKLPYSVIRGEVVNIDVTAFNYLPHCITLELKLLKTRMFILEENDDGSDPKFCICGGKSKSYTFRVKPQVLGKMQINFSAFLREHRISCTSTQAPIGYARKQVTDFVVKEMLVQAEGVQEETTSSHYICPQDTSDHVYNMTFTPDIPEDQLVPGSVQGYVSVIGDIMGSVLSGLDNLVLLPTGCGEQNMVRLAPNIAILKYLRATSQLSDDIETKTLNHMHKGYQQQLQFMHKDGSYSAFGSADKYGSTWLSAFVFKTLRQALDYIYIDRKQIQTKSWEFLISQQGEDGCFTEHGKVLSKYMMGGVAGSKANKDQALTAYVLVAMLESFKMMRERTPPFVALAVRCVEVHNLTDTYTLALVSYAMTLYKPHSPFTEDLIKRLEDKAVTKDDVKYWQRDTKPDILSGQGRAASAEIEMTSYALMAILTRDENAPLSEIIPIVRWLTSQRNAYGGFASTQDTVVALQALSLFAQRIYGRGLDVSVNMVNNVDTLDFHVTQKNSIILQQQPVTSPQSDIHVTAKGEGCFLFQMTSRYNVISKVLPTPAFTLSVTTPVTMEIINNSCRMRTVRVCSSYVGPDTVSDMVVMEVRLTSGWIPDVTTLEQLMNSAQLDLKKYEMDKRNPDVVNFYFDQMDETDMCFDFNVVLEVEVSKQQAAMAKVFDYYESELQMTTMYEMSPCTEDQIEEIDVNIDEDIYLEESNLDPARDSNVNTDFDYTETEETKGDNAPAPAGPSCPRCITTGPVNILEDICKKQVWTLEPVDSDILLSVVAADSVSPELKVPMPDILRHCKCRTSLFREGEKSLAVLEPKDWTNLGSSIAQADTIMLGWSETLQIAIQHVLADCHQK